MGAVLKKENDVESGKRNFWEACAGRELGSNKGHRYFAVVVDGKDPDGSHIQGGGRA